jgi:hypothetical protein
MILPPVNLAAISAQRRNGELKNISLFKLQNSKFKMEAFAGIKANGLCFEVYLNG